GLLRQDRNSDGSYFLNVRRDQFKNNIDVVDHQVQDNVYIQTPWRKLREAMYFKKLRPGCDLLRSNHGRIEPLDMAHLENAAVMGGHRDQLLSFVGRGRNRLLNQNIDSVLQQVQSDPSVLHSRNRKAYSIDFAE